MLEGGYVVLFLVELGVQLLYSLLEGLQVVRLLAGSDWEDGGERGDGRGFLHVVGVCSLGWLCVMLLSLLLLLLLLLPLYGMETTLLVDRVVHTRLMLLISIIIIIIIISISIDRIMNINPNHRYHHPLTNRPPLLLLLLRL